MSCLLWILSPLFISAQSIYFVKPGGNGTGQTWTDAMGNLQQAIDSCDEGDQVWIASGIYYPSREFDADGSGGTDPRERTFYIKKNIAIIGGFKDGELQIQDRDFKKNRTILSGNLGVLQDTSDNAYHVLFIDGSIPSINIVNSCQLDGLYIQDGVASGLNPPNFLGSAMFLRGVGTGNECSPSIENCQISGNFARRGGTVYNYALGGICSPHFKYCSFFNNYSYAGSAIFNNAYDGICESVYLGCIFEDNEASYAGGALYNYGNHGICKLKISDCHFTNNRTQIGGAMYNSSMDGEFVADVYNSIFVDNFAHHKGGAFFNYGYTGQSICNVINCTFYKNIGVHNGGAIRNWYADVNVTNSILWNNGDEIYNTFGTATLNHCIFDDGSPGNGSITYTDGVTGFQSFDLDPNFISYEADINLRLKQNSPALNQGSPDTSGLQLPLNDLDGELRMNGQLDLGAYENPLVNCRQNIFVPVVYCPLEGSYTAQEEIELGDGVVIGSGTISIKAPSVVLNHEVETQVGATLEISQEGCIP